MKLQLSLYQPNLEAALSLAPQIESYVDIVEVGSLMIYRYGTQAVIKISEAFQATTILADVKMADRAKDTVNLFADSGATWLTLLAGTRKDIIRSACTAAHNQGKKIMLNLIDASSLNQSALEAENLGVDALLFYQPYDEPNQLEFFENWEMVRGNTKLPLYLSAHITQKNIINILQHIKPDGIIVDSAILDAEDPIKAAQFFQELCSKY